MKNSPQWSVVNHRCLLCVLLVTVAINPTLAQRTVSTRSASKPDATGFTSNQRAWGLAASALLTEANRERHDLLGGSTRTEAWTKYQTQRLSRWWDVTDRTTLLNVLGWIDEGGHRREFASIGQHVSQFDIDRLHAVVASQSLDEQSASQIFVARNYYQKLGDQSLVGWDYARYISLCRWGYIVGYLTEDEAWQKILYAARIIQRTFGSWQELGQNYLIGREFWSYEQSRTSGANYRAAYKKLLENPQSPWNRIPWNLDLRLADESTR